MVVFMMGYLKGLYAVAPWPAIELGSIDAATDAKLAARAEAGLRGGAAVKGFGAPGQRGPSAARPIGGPWADAGAVRQAMAQARSRLAISENGAEQCC